jgi:hypothetical protein
MIVMKSLPKRSSIPGTAQRVKVEVSLGLRARGGVVFVVGYLTLTVAQKADVVVVRDIGVILMDADYSLNIVGGGIGNAITTEDIPYSKVSTERGTKIVKSRCTETRKSTELVEEHMSER